MLETSPASTATRTWHDVYRSPIGPLGVVVDGDGGLCGVVFGGAVGRGWPASVADARRCAPVVAQLEEYFAGRRRRFDLELRPGGTEFQRTVWRELQRIPFGATVSYAELARRIGRPQAVRAVGGANGRNPIPIVVPCHRVIGADGSLTGFGGGVALKRALLRHEGVAVEA